MRIPVNAPLCPQCKRSMRAHCSVRCRWVFCGVCWITKDRKTGVVIGWIGDTSEREVE
jgi:hypothetical protein